MEVEVETAFLVKCKQNGPFSAILISGQASGKASGNPNSRSDKVDTLFLTTKISNKINFRIIIKTTKWNLILSIY